MNREHNYPPLTNLSEPLAFPTLLGKLAYVQLIQGQDKNHFLSFGGVLYKGGSPDHAFIVLSESDQYGGVTNGFR